MHARDASAAPTLESDQDPTTPPGRELAHRLSVLLGIRGLAAVVFGVLTLAWPGITILALAWLFAAYVVVDGVGMIVSGVRARGGHRWIHVLAGIAGVIAGFAALVWPGLTALVLVLWAGAWAVITGVLEIAAALRGATPGRWLVLLAGVLSVLAGLFIVSWPGVGAFVLATVLGIYALAAGVTYLWAAWRLRQATVVALAW